MSKTFDNGVICASEQSVIVVRALYEAVKTGIRRARRGDSDTKTAAKAGREFAEEKQEWIPTSVGQPAAKIATMAGLDCRHLSQLC